MITTDTTSQLRQLANKFKHLHFNSLMSPQRAEDYGIQAGSLYLNYARNPINPQVVTALLKLAETTGVRAKIDAMFAGDSINRSENRAVKHWLLRAPRDDSDADSVAVHDVLDKMQQLADKVADDSLLDDPVSDIICVGIGGSELGSRLVYEALTMGRKKRIRVHFVANIDGMAIADAIANCRPETTLFLMISKTFTTFETTKNFETLKAWFCTQENCDEARFWRQSCAVTANVDGALAAGVPASQIFTFWEWVGGRFSLWSSVGLPIALACGMPAFRELLAGAHAMDEHFKQADFNDNLPVMLGLLHVWYSCFLGYPTRCVVPYAQNLKSLPEFLQQLEMESLGKSVNEASEPLDNSTCPVVWGAVGSNAQHAFFQLLHQGTQIVPMDFIAALTPCDDLPAGLDDAMREHQTAVLANCLAQSESLMNGGDTRQDGHGHFAGNRPSNILLMDKVTPYALGQLLAAYEHKVLVQSALWGINAFDQFGVELGKQMCNKILAETTGELTLATIKQTLAR
ncbi:MAG: glucose-6-phosphate isomerase [Gammaproteobacteria bacterium]|nr:MAG: glucose-6-phosphate isomerase [Gammaproteobacteria bacterium]